MTHEIHFLDRKAWFYVFLVSLTLRRILRKRVRTSSWCWPKNANLKGGSTKREEWRTSQVPLVKGVLTSWIPDRQKILGWRIFVASCSMWLRMALERAQWIQCTRSLNGWMVSTKDAWLSYLGSATIGKKYCLKQRWPLEDAIASFSRGQPNF